jgi:hypothetical protein
LRAAGGALAGHVAQYRVASPRILARSEDLLPSAAGAVGRVAGML